MPVRTNVLERLFLLRLNRGPGPILDLYGAGAFEVAVLASNAGVFDALSADPKPLDELAADLGFDADVLESLLSFLAVTGYVDDTRNGYRASDLTTAWFQPDAETDVTPWLRMWHEVMFPYWEDTFERALRGESEQTVYEWLSTTHPERWPVVQEGFAALGRIAVGPVLDLADVPDDAETLLDLGGGHGVYTTGFVEAFDLDAVIFDDPAALDYARETVADAGLDDRIDFQGGDYTTDDLGGPYDVVLLFNVVHGHDEAETRVLLDKVADALAPGGRLLVLDQFQGGRTRVARTAVRFSDLVYHTMLGGRVHEYSEVAAWLREAGLGDVQKHTSFKLPGTPLVEATK